MHLHVIDTGFFKLDGGAMFGVVPNHFGKGLTLQMKTTCVIGQCVVCY